MVYRHLGNGIEGESMKTGNISFDNRTFPPLQCIIIVMSNRKDFFTNTILTRGRAISDAGHAIKLVSNRNDDGSTTIVAAVTDAYETYQTSLTLDKDNELQDAYCSCQYHAKNIYCKHIAALLYSEVGDSRTEPGN